MAVAAPPLAVNERATKHAQAAKMTYRLNPISSRDVHEISSLRILE